jgi:hypothetical protein
MFSTVKMPEVVECKLICKTGNKSINIKLQTSSSAFFYVQVQDENKNAEYLCLSHNPFADVIGVGLDNGHIKLFDERTLQVYYT